MEDTVGGVGEFFLESIRKDLSITLGWCRHMPMGRPGTNSTTKMPKVIENLHNLVPSVADVIVVSQKETHDFVYHGRDC